MRFNNQRGSALRCCCADGPVDSLSRTRPPSRTICGTGPAGRLPALRSNFFGHVEEFPVADPLKGRYADRPLTDVFRG